MRSLVANLLDNAIRHNLPGGQAEITTALTTAGAVVSVSNTGTPVPPDAVQDLFQPFRQLGTERTRRGEDTGSAWPSSAPSPTPTAPPSPPAPAPQAAST